MKEKKKLFITLCLFAIVVFSNGVIPGYVNGFSHYSKLSLPVYWSNDQADYYVSDRLSDPVFKKRIILTKAQVWLENKYSIPAQGSFNILNFLFLVWTVSLIYLLSRTYYKTSFSEALLGVGFFLLSMPILFAFSGYTSSYDDFLQYAVVLQLFYFFYRSNYFLSMVFFFLSLIIRETSLIFILPILFFRNGFSFRQKLLLIGVGMALYFYFLSSISSSVDSIEFFVNKRFSAWKANFSSGDRALEVLFCFLIVLGVPIRILVGHPNKSQEMLVLILLITINSFLVTISALVHETRLLFLPLLLLFPMLGSLVEFHINYQYLKSVKFFVFAVIISVAVFSLFVQSEVGETSIFYNLYAIFGLIFLVGFPSFLRFKKVKINGFRNDLFL